MTAATFIAVACGYVLFALTAGLFAVECYLRFRDQRCHAAQLANRDRHIGILTARCGFLDRQNRALFGRCVQHPTRPRCRATAGRGTG